MFLSFPRISKSNQDAVPDNHAQTRLVQSRILKIKVCKYFGGELYLHISTFPKRQGC